MANPVLGLTLHAIGGFAAASFYIPNKKVTGWSWERYWLSQGFVSWIIAPILGAVLTIPNLWEVLSGSPHSALLLAYVFGVLWGVGGLTFGLSMRYLGISLGYALALGFTAAFGTLIPPLFQPDPIKLVTTASGLTTLAGIAVALAGVAVCAYAGSLKEKELSTAEKRATIVEFAYTKGLAIAVFSGIMSACIAFAYTAGAPIAKAAVAAGAAEIYSNNAVLVIVLLGGFTTNLIWCVYLMKWKPSDKSPGSPAPIANLALATLGGALWYLQFFFYGMGTTQLGKYNFASWTIHMSFIIVFSTLWGLALREWAGTKPRTRQIVIAGIVILVLSTCVIGYGSYLGSLK